MLFAFYCIVILNCGGSYIYNNCKIGWEILLDLGFEECGSLEENFHGCIIYRKRRIVMLTDGNMLIKDYGYNRKGAHHANLILFKIIGVEVGLLLWEILFFFNF